MENIEEKNLPLSEQQAETQASDELNTEELEAVAGGLLDEVKEGARDLTQGLADGLGGESNGEDNFNYLAGNVVGKGVNAVIPG